MTHILLMYSWHIIQPTFFLLLSWQNTSTAVWKCVPLLQLQNSSFKKSFYMFALNDEEKKNKTPCDGTDNRSLCTRGTNVCGWFCMNFVLEMWTCEAVGLIYKISHREKLSCWGNQKTLCHCWARIVQITSSGKTFLNLVSVYLISIVLVIVAWYQFHRQLRQVRGDSTGSVTDRGERWDAEPSEVSYNTPKRLRCGEKKKHKRNVTETNELHCDVITWTVTTSGPPNWATVQTYKLPRSSCSGRMLQQRWLQGRRMDENMCSVLLCATDM